MIKPIMKLTKLYKTTYFVLCSSVVEFNLVFVNAEILFSGANGTI